MEFFDQHIHSCFSFDSTEDPQNYINEETKIFTITDHFEWINPLNDYVSDIPDFKKIDLIKDQLLQERDVRLLSGVEVGYTSKYKSEIENIINTTYFDHIILSCHHNNTYDYMDSKIKSQSEDPVYQYFEQLINAVTETDFADILAHFDYGVRIHNFSTKNLKDYKSYLEELLSKAIQKGLSLELNSKSMYIYDNFDLYDYVIPLYQSLGGNSFSLGSDAHKKEDLFLHFKESINLLEHYGVEYVQVFVDKKPYHIPLDQIL